MLARLAAALVDIGNPDSGSGAADWPSLRCQAHQPAKLSGESIESIDGRRAGWNMVA